MQKNTETTKHHLDEAFDLLDQILQEMLDDSAINKRDKFSEDIIQKFNELNSNLTDLFKHVKTQKLPLEYEFFAIAALLIDKITLVRDDDVFIARAIATTDSKLLSQLDFIVARIYAIVYSNQLVRKIMGNVAHVAEKTAKTKDKIAGQKLVDEMWEKVRKAGLASEAADKRLSVVVKKMQEEYDVEEELSEDLYEDFRSASLDVYLLEAVFALALEELATAKAHLIKLIAKM